MQHTLRNFHSRMPQLHYRGFAEKTGYEVDRNNPLLRFNSPHSFRLRRESFDRLSRFKSALSPICRLVKTRALTQHFKPPLAPLPSTLTPAATPPKSKFLSASAISSAPSRSLTRKKRDETYFNGSSFIRESEGTFVTQIRTSWYRVEFDFLIKSLFRTAGMPSRNQERKLLAVRSASASLLRRLAEREGLVPTRGIALRSSCG